MPSTEPQETEAPGRARRGSALASGLDRLFAVGPEGRLALALAAFAVLVRTVYVFVLTDFESHLFSDMRGYWNRAHDALFGDLRNPSQWLIQPPFFHLVLARVLELTRDVFGLWSHRLEAILGIQTFLGGVSVYHLTRIAGQLLPRSAAIGAGLFLALTFPLIHLNAFVMTENLAIPLLIAASYYAFARRPSPLLLDLLLTAALVVVLRMPLVVVGAALVAVWALRRLAGPAGGRVTAGLLLACTIGVRPAALPMVVPFAAVATLVHGWRPDLRAGGAFLASLSLGLGLVVFYNAVASGGRVVGPAGMGGVAFYFAQCGVDRMVFHHGDRGYWIVQPGSEGKANPVAVTASEPIYRQGHYYRKGLRCLGRSPAPLTSNLKRLGGLFSGTFHPAVDVPRWSSPLNDFFFLPVFLVLLLAGVLGAPWCVRRDDPERTKMLVFFWTLPVITIALHLAFTVEQRYLLPAVPAIVLTAGCVASRVASLFAAGDG